MGLGYLWTDRERLERDRSSEFGYPKEIVSRSIAFCSNIYGMATHDEAFAPQKLDIKLRTERATRGPTSNALGSELVMQGLRSYRGVQDGRCGFLIAGVMNKDQEGKINQLYIVFRGSRSDTPGGKHNPMGAGFGTMDYLNGGKVQNVDYAANLTSHLLSPSWAPGVGIRSGFLEMYKSMEKQIFDCVSERLRENPDIEIIVTGHSLGAALAVVCAHHLQYALGARMKNRGPFCFPFCTPRVGNKAFATDFLECIGIKTVHKVEGEATIENGYRRCINFTMHHDLVSNRGKYQKAEDSEDDEFSQGSKVAMSDMAGKIFNDLWTSRKKGKKDEIRFYQTPNVYLLGKHTYHLGNKVHQYTWMQKRLIGSVAYAT